MVNKNDNGLLNNLSWKFAERLSAQLVTTIVSIILARILEPEHYGLISIVSIFITLANVFVSDGLGTALIQKKDPDALDYSSVLYFNIIFSVLIYIVLFFLAPLISSFYDYKFELLTPVLRVLGLRIIIASINSVQHAYVSKKMIFKQFFFATLFGTLASAIVGISMAYMGFGVWALVAQYLTNSIIDTIFLAFSLKKLPIKKFSMKRVKNLLGFGSRILASSLLINFFNEIRTLIIGKKYKVSDLAYFDKGKQLPGLIVTNINSSIGAVLYPKMANEQNNILKIKEIVRKSIRFSSFVMFPLMLGFSAIAKSFVLLVLTEKWIEAVPYLQLFCIFYLFQPIHSANMQAIKAVGRGDIYLKNEIIKKVIEIITLIITMFISVKAIALGMVLCSVVFVLFNSYPNKKLINYSLTEQFKDFYSPMIMAIIMYIVVYFVGKINISLFPLMCLQIIIGGMVYIGLSIITKNKELKYIVEVIKNKIVKKHG